MKKLSFLAVIIFCTIFVWKYQTQTDHRSSWVAYEKEDEKLVIREPIAQEKVFLADEKDESDQQNQKPTRQPASQKSGPRFQERLVLGNIDQEVMEGEKDLKAINEPSPDWQNSFASYLLDTQEKETKLFLKHVDSSLLVRGDRGRYTEEVIVTFQLPNKNISSYVAMVDSESGQMINTWSYTVNHNFRAAPPRLTPSGAIYSR